MTGSYMLIDIIRKYPQAKGEAIGRIEKEIQELKEIRKELELKHGKMYPKEPIPSLIEEWESLFKYLTNKDD